MVVYEIRLADTLPSLTFDNVPNGRLATIEAQSQPVIAPTVNEESANQPHVVGRQLSPPIGLAMADAISNTVGNVGLSSIPAEIAQVIVQPLSIIVTVMIMTCFHTWRARTDERHQNQPRGAN